MEVLRENLPVKRRRRRASMRVKSYENCGALYNEDMNEFCQEDTLSENLCENVQSNTTLELFDESTIPFSTKRSYSDLEQPEVIKDFPTQDLFIDNITSESDGTPSVGAVLTVHLDKISSVTEVFNTNELPSSPSRLSPQTEAIALEISTPVLIESSLTIRSQIMEFLRTNASS